MVSIHSSDGESFSDHTLVQAPQWCQSWKSCVRHVQNTDQKISAGKFASVLNNTKNPFAANLTILLFPQHSIMQHLVAPSALPHSNFSPDMIDTNPDSTVSPTSAS